MYTFSHFTSQCVNYTSASPEQPDLLGGISAYGRGFGTR